MHHPKRNSSNYTSYVVHLEHKMGDLLHIAHLGVRLHLERKLRVLWRRHKRWERLVQGFPYIGVEAGGEVREVLLPHHAVPEAQ